MMVKRAVIGLTSAALLVTALTACVPKNPHNLPVDHIVVLMQENRSADTYLGQLNAFGQPGYPAEPDDRQPRSAEPDGPADRAVPQDDLLREQ